MAEAEGCGCKCCTDRTDCTMHERCEFPATLKALSELHAAIDSFLDWNKINSSMALRVKMKNAEKLIAKHAKG